jgi:isopenicillin N synthase-like dioxygenase
MTTATAIPANTQFPVIDFAPFLSGDPKAKRQVARAIVDACEGPGFFYLAQHWISQSEFDAIFAQSKRFFALPLDHRMTVLSNGSRGYRPYGYFQKAGSDKKPNLMEHYIFQADLPPDDPDILAGNHVHALNKWPENLPGWREAMLHYFSAVDKVSREMLRAFALAVDLDENYFAKFFRKPTSAVKLFHYPPQPPTSADEQVGLGSHFDDTAMTILLQDDVGGLQVERGRGKWVDVTPIPGTFVINIGEVMSRWVNDRFVPTPHRVINLSGRERYSIPFFALPDYDAMIACVPTCRGPGNPPKYPPRLASFFQSRAFRDRNWQLRHNRA